MASTPAKLLTFQEYEQIPNPPGGRYELYHGELVNIAFPEHRHQRAQRQIRRLLENAVGDGGIVEAKAYRPVPEYECWSADVAYLTNERWNNIDRWLAGAPDLVVEVLSPSNTATEILDKKKPACKTGRASSGWWTWTIDWWKCLRLTATPVPTYRASRFLSFLAGPSPWKTFSFRVACSAT